MIAMNQYSLETLLIGKVKIIINAGMGLIDYCSYVKHPMDLSIINRKLRE
jgi:hypothetical protein